VETKVEVVLTRPYLQRAGQALIAIELVDGLQAFPVALGEHGSEIGNRNGLGAPVISGLST
jgi:hypothetical protein